MSFRVNKRGRYLLSAVAAAMVALPTGGAIAGSGGVAPSPGPAPTVPGAKAKLRANGVAVAPASAPQKVKDAIAAANAISSKPYRLGGGHAHWRSRAYDCSGATSYVLGKYGAKVLSAPEPSGSLMKWGKRGKGSWITVYADGGHAMVVIAGLRFDTSHAGGERGKPGTGPRWSKNVKAGFVNFGGSKSAHRLARHRPGL